MSDRPARPARSEALSREERLRHRQEFLTCYRQGRRRHGSLLIGVAARLSRWILLGLGRTWKIRVIAGGEHVETLLADPHGVILSFWHNRVFVAAYYLYDRLHRGGLDITLLASQSRDGELVTRVCKRWGLNTVRGSASRGGMLAMRALHRALTRRGSSPILIPDGPRGPIYEFKVGVAVIAQTSRAPILPIGFAARRFWRLKSWDRIIVPLPFSEVTVAVGAPEHLSRGLSSEELEVERQRLEELLDELTLRAEAAVDAEDVARPRGKDRME